MMCQRDQTVSTDPAETNSVFEVARSLLPAATAFALKVRLDSDTAQEAMREAAKRVLEVQRSERGEGSLPRVRNLPGYLFTVYRNVIFAELKRREREPPLIDDLNARGLDSGGDEIRSVENRILISEIVKRMNPKSRIIFNYRVLGYSFEEIAGRFKTDMGTTVTAAALRSEYSKAISRIIEEIDL